jgi:putative spermidine/putrescine transport system substrate-binding protein
MRHSLRLATTTAALAGLCLSAQAEELVVGSFGGSFADNVKACHVAAFEKATGATVALKLGNSSQFAAAVRATGGKPDMDIVYIDNSLGRFEGPAALKAIMAKSQQAFPDTVWPSKSKSLKAISSPVASHGAPPTERTSMSCLPRGST